MILLTLRKFIAMRYWLSLLNFQRKCTMMQDTVTAILLITRPQVLCKIGIVNIWQNLHEGTFSDSPFQ